MIGALWNGSDTPPESMDGGRQQLSQSAAVAERRQGHARRQDGQERFVAETPGGQKITLKDGPGTVEIVDSNGNSVKLGPSGITVDASAKVTITASLLEVSASMVTVNAAMSKFSGVVQADTVISNSVISASYTPGAGNIW